MTKNHYNPKYFNILLAKEAFAKGENITGLLRSQKLIAHNTSEIIETAYDLQAGSYIKYANDNPDLIRKYAFKLSNILNKYISTNKSLLDIGTGEFTTISFVSNNLIHKPKQIYAFDISWSRIYKGLQFAKKNMGDYFNILIPFVGDIKEIPLLSKSIDITTSSHALEPNGSNLPQLMAELFRVTSDKVILFEPCYEINSEEGKRRMDDLGYIKNIEGVIKDLKGTLLEKIVIESPINPLNPTVCFVIQPPISDFYPKSVKIPKESIFSVPGSDFNLNIIDNYYYSNITGLCFPIIKSIPILKSINSILASALLD
jgi:ubiquinone/menaquinone biosynthesis C-methylase UbiE